jgi:hypothetical protein
MTRKYFSAGLATLDRLVRLYPGHVGWQRDLAVAYLRIGEVAAAQDDLSAALKSFAASIAITSLAAADPGNGRWQRELARTHASSATCWRVRIAGRVEVLPGEPRDRGTAGVRSGRLQLVA